MPKDIRIIPASASIQFSGSAVSNIQLQVQDSGSVSFVGTSGSLMTVEDSFSGSLMSVGNISGLPLLEVFDDGTVISGPFNANTLVVTGSRVGIGNRTPGSSLDILGVQANTGSTSVSNPSGTLRLGFKGSWDNQQVGASLVFTQEWASTIPGSLIGVGQITGYKDNANGSYGGGLSFWTSNQNTNAMAERMRIDKAGNVGIGIAAPTTKLHIKGIGDTSATTAFRVENSSGTARLIMSDDGTTAFNTNHLFISSSGNIGIGSSGGISSWATNRLTVVNDAVINPSNLNAIANNSNNYATQGILKVESINNALYMGVSSAVNDPRSWIQSGHEISQYANGTGPILLNPVGGNIGIGILNYPEFKLDVSGSGRFSSNLQVTGSIIAAAGSEQTTINFSGITMNRFYSYIRPDINNSRALFFGDVNRQGADWGTITFNATNFTVNSNTISFASGSGNIVRISSNNVGIGTTSPTARLQVNGAGTTSATTALLVQNSGNTTLFEIDDNGQFVLNTPSQTLPSGQAGLTISQSITTTNTPGSTSNGVNILPVFTANTGSLTQTALRVVPTFTGSFATSSLNANIIAQFGTTGVGTQLSITDITSGSIYQVNDISGLPILEVTSDWGVKMYNFPVTVFEKTGSQVIINGTLNATGSFIFPLTSSTSPQVGSAFWSGSFLYIWDGAQYRSSSFS